MDHSYGLGDDFYMQKTVALDMAQGSKLKLRYRHCALYHLAGMLLPSITPEAVRPEFQLALPQIGHHFMYALQIYKLTHTQILIRVTSLYA